MSAQGFDPELFLQMGQEVLAQQAFSRLLGAELAHLAPGEAELRLALRDELGQPGGAAHPGVVGYLAETALTFAGGTAMRVPVATSQFTINHLRPAQGERLVARAQAVGVGRLQSVCRCEVYAVVGLEESLCALAQGTVTKTGEAPPG